MEFSDKDKAFDLNTKEQIKDFTWLEIHGYILVMTNQVEFQMDQIIEAYLRPRREDFFKTVMLDSSVITLFGKTVILRSIIRREKEAITKMLKDPSGTMRSVDKILQIRNRFAHKTTYVTYIEDSDVKGEKYESKYNILSRGGNFDSISAWDDAFEFEKHAKLVLARFLFWAKLLQQ